MGENYHQEGPDVTKIITAFIPDDMFFVLPGEPYKRMGDLRRQRYLFDEPDQFLGSETFKTSFLSKAKLLVSNFGNGLELE